MKKKPGGVEDICVECLHHFMLDGSTMALTK